MKARSLFYGAAIAICTAAITSQVVSQQDKGQPTEMSPEQAAMMQKWEEFMTPGEHHKLLEPKVGKWTAVVKMWMDPNQPEPTVSDAKAEYKWIMDGRYLLNTTEGDFGGMPFHGQAWEGYDNLKKKFAWVWIDNMGTGFMDAEGTYDAATKTFTYNSMGPDVMSGKYVAGRSTEKWIDNDHFVGDMYGPGPDGKVYKMMEISYTRAK